MHAEGLFTANPVKWASPDFRKNAEKICEKKEKVKETLIGNCQSDGDPTSMFGLCLICKMTAKKNGEKMTVVYQPLFDSELYLHTEIHRMEFFLETYEHACISIRSMYLIVVWRKLIFYVSTSS